MRGLTFLVILMCAQIAAGGSPDPLTFVGFNRDLAINGVSDIAISPYGSRVYAATKGGDAISVFSRDVETGDLSWRSAVRAEHLAPAVFENPEAISISPDGGHAYVAAFSGVFVFERDSEGDLTFLEVHRDDEGGLVRLGWPKDVIVSPDDKHVYVAATNDDSLVVFSRDRTTGLLTYLASYTDGTGGVDGLDGALALAISSDGKSVYATASGDNAVAVFDRDPVTGLLTFFDVYKDSYVGIDGLAYPSDVVVSADGANVYAVGHWDDAIAVFQRNPVNGLLTFLEVVEDGVGGVNHLDGVSTVLVSPDGSHLYAVAGYDDAITVFARAPADGALSQLGVEQSAVPISANLTSDGAGFVVGSAGFSGLTAFSRDSATGLLSHEDDEFSAPGLDGAVGVTAAFDPCVYVAGDRAGSVQSLARSAQNGPLLPAGNMVLYGPPDGTRAVAASRTKNHVYTVGFNTNEIVRVSYDGPPPCRVDNHTTSSVHYGNASYGIHGLLGPQHLPLSPDETHLYVASYIAGAVVVFSRDPEDGSLTFVETVYDGVGSNDGLDGAYWVEPSPDGEHLYVAGYVDDAIGVFHRNPITGTLVFQSVVRDGVGGVDGLDGVNSVAVSPDGRHAYAAGRNDDSVAIFVRNPTNGGLEYLTRVIDGISGIEGLDGARAVAVSPDGRQVYAVGQNDDALAVFSRDAVSGILTQVGLHRDGVAGVDGLDTANGVAVSPDGMQVYVTGYGDNAVATFYRSDIMVFSDGFEGGNTGAWSSTVGLP